MLKSCGENRYSWFQGWGKAVNILSLPKIFSVGFSEIHLIKLKKSHSIHSLLKLIEFYNFIFLIPLK